MKGKEEIFEKKRNNSRTKIQSKKMIEIEAKTKLKSSEGAHFFFTLIFLSASGLIERQYSEESCKDVNLVLLVDLIFYS